MTGAEERELLRDYVQTCARLKTGLERAAEQVAARLPIGTADLEAIPVADENNMLAYLKRFEQFEDALARTLKTIAQIMALGKIERLQPRDVANRAEAFGIVANADDWSEAVRTRNALAHEYPLRPDKRADQVNRAWHARTTLLATWAGILSFIEQEGLLDDRL